MLCATKSPLPRSRGSARTPADRWREWEQPASARRPRAASLEEAATDRGPGTRSGSGASSSRRPRRAGLPRLDVVAVPRVDVPSTISRNWRRRASAASPAGSAGEASCRPTYGRAEARCRPRPASSPAPRRPPRRRSRARRAGSARLAAAPAGAGAPRRRRARRFALLVAGLGPAGPSARPNLSSGYGSSQTDSTSGSPGPSWGSAAGP